jgi:hypothetical protein
MKHLAPSFLFLVLPLIIFAGTVNAEPWRGIVPLKSTRSDVERLLGKPLPGSVNSYVTYKLESEEVRVVYADKTLCSRTDDCKCRVPDDTVLNVVVRLKTPLKFSSLKLDLSKFHPIINRENANNVAYSNSDAGLMYVISERDDLVLYLQYGPTAKDCADALTRRRPDVTANRRVLDFLGVLRVSAVSVREVNPPQRHGEHRGSTEKWPKFWQGLNSLRGELAQTR